MNLKPVLYSLLIMVNACSGINKKTDPVVTESIDKTAVSTSLNKTDSANLKTTKKALQPAPLYRPYDKNSDTLVYYYSNGKISVKITPMDKYRRIIYFFDTLGKTTYQLTEILGSCRRVVTTLTFKDNGSIDTAITQNCPGESMYWYLLNTTFSDNNEPLSRVKKQMSEQRIKASWTSYWDKNKKDWVRQMSME